VDFDAVRAGLPNATFKDASRIVLTTRMVKSPLEIEIMREGCRLTCRAFRKALQYLRPGLSEVDLARVLATNMMKEGADRPGFILMRAGPERARMKDTLPTHRKIQKGELFFTDTGAVFRGYYSDMLRVAFLGKPPEKVERHYEVVLKAQMSAIDEVEPGVRASHIFKTARDTIKGSGYKLVSMYEYETCRAREEVFPTIELVGHGIGLDIHEPPTIKDEEETLLEPGMVITIEPWIWDPSIGVFCVEDDILVTKKGHEVLTKDLEKELCVVPC
jgi:Xaa-Pro aminopeptidase